MKVMSTSTITFQDQRQSKTTQIEADLDGLYILADKAGIDLNGADVRIRLRDGNGPYGFTTPLGNNTYRVVINIRYKKRYLSDDAKYVVNNTLLHELRHVTQMQGSKALSHSYDGWSETEARKYGRTIKDQAEFFALA